MRPVDVFRFTGPLLGVAIGALIARYRLVRSFEKASATSAGQAIDSIPKNPFHRWWLRRLLERGVIVSTVDGRHWLDRDAWETYREIRRRRALIVLVVLLALLLIVLAWR